MMVESNAFEFLRDLLSILEAKSLTQFFILILHDLE